MTDEDLIKHLKAWYFPECHIVYLIETRIEQLKGEVTMWKEAYGNHVDVSFKRISELLSRIKELEQEARERQHD